MRNRKLLLFSGISSILCIIILAILDNIIRPVGSPNMLELQFSFFTSRFKEILYIWGEKSLYYLKIALAVDYFFAISYSLFLSTIISFLNFKGKGKFKIFFIFPLFAGIFDIIENTLYYIIILQLPKDIIYLVPFTTIISIIKWGLVIFSICYIVYLSSKRVFFKIS